VLIIFIFVCIPPFILQDSDVASLKKKASTFDGLAQSQLPKTVVRQKEKKTSVGKGKPKTQRKPPSAEVQKKSRERNKKLYRVAVKDIIDELYQQGPDVLNMSVY